MLTLFAIAFVVAMITWLVSSARWRTPRHAAGQGADGGADVAFFGDASGDGDCGDGGGDGGGGDGGGGGD